MKLTYIIICIKVNDTHSKVRCALVLNVVLKVSIRSLDIHKKDNQKDVQHGVQRATNHFLSRLPVTVSSRYKDSKSERLLSSSLAASSLFRYSTQL